MADTAVSDEEQYANESFENESDNEMPNELNNEVEQKTPQVSDDTESEIDSDSDADIEFESITTKSNSINTFNQSRFNSHKDCMPYDSSSDDEDDVVISETIAEINTEPMRLEDVAKTPKSSLTQLDSVERQSKISATSESEESEEGSGDDDGDEEVEVDENYDLEFDQQREEEVVQEAERVEEHQSNAEGKSLKEEKPTEELPNTEIEDDFEKDIDDEGDELDAVSSSYELKSAPTHVKLTEEGVPFVERSIELKPPSDEQCRKELRNYDAIEENSTSLTEANTEYEYEYEPKIEFRISSHTPSSFNTNEYGFHMNIIKNSSSATLCMKAQPRKSWSFSNTRMREIERQNQILLKKILTQKPTYLLDTPRCSSQHKFASLPPTTRVTSAAVNRKKQQRQIDLDNQVLKRKIEAIQLRRPHL